MAKVINDKKGIKLTEKGFVGRNFVQTFWSLSAPLNMKSISATLEVFQLEVFGVAKSAIN